MEYKLLDKSYIDQIREVEAAVYESLPDKKWWVLYKDSELESIFDDKGNSVFGALDDGRLVSFSLGRGNESDGVMTLPAYQGNGIAKKLLGLTIDFAKSEGSHSEFLYFVHPTNIPSRKLAVSSGFTLFKTKATYPVSGTEFDLYERDMYIKVL
jgi:GNAT superfamily N-acetyltransferase